MEKRERRERPLVELALLFARLGLTAFGGPAAHTAMIRHEVVERRRWLTDDELLDLVSATNFIPGPNSTELAIHIGHRRAGWRGLVVAGACFILPAALLTFAFAWLYVRYGRLPQAEAMLYGVKPVIVAVVLHALVGLGRTALKTKTLEALGVLSVIACMLGVHELVVLFAAGAVHAALRGGGGGLTKTSGAGTSALVLGGVPVAAGTALGLAVPSSTSIFLVFAKIGSVLFGSGYVLVAFLRADLVVARHWLTEGQLLDAVAAGQVTPGPLFTTATFVGYLVGGAWGALAATLGIFLPAFFFVAMSHPLLPKLRRSPRAGAFLDGLNIASLALMAYVSVSLAHAALVDVWTVVLAVTSTIVLLRWKVSSLWLVLGGAIAGNVLRVLP